MAIKHLIRGTRMALGLPEIKQVYSGVDDGKPRTNTYYGRAKCARCNTLFVCPTCEASKRGKVKSKAKSRAARKNGKLGGRPHAALSDDGAHDDR